MRAEKLTVKAQEAMQDARRLAERRGHQQLEPEHVLHAVLALENSPVPAILNKIGVDPSAVTRRLEEHLDRLPQVS